MSRNKNTNSRSISPIGHIDKNNIKENKKPVNKTGRIKIIR